MLSLFCLICVLGGILAKSYNDESDKAGRQQEGWSWYDQGPADTIDIDNDQGDVWSGKYESSGWGEDDDDDSFAGSGGGPGRPTNSRKTNCESLRDDLNKKTLIGAYIPRCTRLGDFEAMQCHGSTGECWCVNRDGQEIRGTSRRAPDRPDCHSVDRSPPLIEPGRRPGVGSNNNPGNKDEHRPPYTPTDPNDGLVYDPPNEDPKDNTVVFTNMDGDNDDEDDEDAVKSEKSDYESPIIGNPGWLAAIIGGAVVGLLCAVLLVMFTVYRMRKKDEGSYALEEPKMTSPSRGYHRAPTKEYWA